VSRQQALSVEDNRHRLVEDIVELASSTRNRGAGDLAMLWSSLISPSKKGCHCASCSSLCRRNGGHPNIYLLWGMQDISTILSWPWIPSISTAHAHHLEVGPEMVECLLERVADVGLPVPLVPGECGTHA
jgi:hypothetical protein